MYPRVVKDAIGRSGMRDVSGPFSRPRRRLRGRFGFSGECRAKGAVGSVCGTGWEGVAGWDQKAI